MIINGNSIIIYEGETIIININSDNDTIENGTINVDPGDNIEININNDEEIEKRSLKITDEGGNDYIHYIRSNVSNINFNINNKSYNVTVEEFDSSYYKIKANDDYVKPEFNFKNSNFKVNKNDEFTLTVYYEENIINDNIIISAYKDGYYNSNEISFDISAKSIQPDSITLSNGAILNKKSNNIYEGTLKLQESTTLYIKNSYNNTSCNIEVIDNNI